MRWSGNKQLCLNAGIEFIHLSGCICYRHVQGPRGCERQGRGNLGLGLRFFCAPTIEFCLLRLDSTRLGAYVWLCANGVLSWKVPEPVLTTRIMNESRPIREKRKQIFYNRCIRQTIRKHNVAIYFLQKKSQQIYFLLSIISGLLNFQLKYYKEICKIE